MKELSDAVRKELYKSAGIKRDRHHNVHHIIQKQDVKRGLVNKRFPVNARFNLIPLDIEVHAQLHDLIENNIAYRHSIESRVWLANYAFNNELDLL